jgi:hypothetical protein
MKRTDAGEPDPAPKCARQGCSKKSECSHVACPLRKNITADFTHRGYYVQLCCGARNVIDGVCRSCGDQP